MKKVAGLILAGMLLAGCSHWFQTRVDRLDAKIAALEQQRETADTNDIARIDQQISATKAERDVALGGALEEQKNRQAMLMALLALGAQGLNVAAGMAKKGATGI